MPFQKLAALGAFGVAFGCAALYALVIFIGKPVPNGGIDITNGILTWISLAIPIAAIAAVHVVYGKVLLDDEKKQAK